MRPIEKDNTKALSNVIQTDDELIQDHLKLVVRGSAEEAMNALLVAVGVNADGYLEILRISEGGKADKKGWSAFLQHLKERG